MVWVRDVTSGEYQNWVALHYQRQDGGGHEAGVKDSGCELQRGIAGRI
jgi:hypothetical protein